MSETANCITEEHCGFKQPKDPWNFAKAIEYKQDSKLLNGRHNILFNKGRYFETSIYNKDVLNKISELTNIPIKYNNMIVGSWKQLEDFVIGMNILGIYVDITIDWI
jgi:hypothetical protein